MRSNTLEAIREFIMEYLPNKEIYDKHEKTPTDGVEWYYDREERSIY